MDKPTTILVVDDEQDMTELLEFNLKHDGFRVLTARNGAEALNIARAELPDLILLDLMLPELDGLTVCELLRQVPATAEIPIIMVTAWSTEKSRTLGFELGADDYVTKPFSPQELLLRIKRLLRRTATPQRATAG